MQDLNSEINTVIRKFGLANGNVVDSLSRLVPILSVILTLIITVGTVLTGLDDAPEGGTDEPPVVAPVAPVAKEQMRTDLLRAINYHRHVPADFDLALHTSAQKQAVVNATAGKLAGPTSGDGNVLMLQARESTAVASVDGFVELWMNDSEGDNHEALMHPSNDSIGIGVAEANGQTYAVVQFMQR